MTRLADHTRIRRDVLGEFQLSLYLEQGVSPEAARRAAAGWGGDLLEGYRGEGGAGPPLLLHLTSWDSEGDALEFCNAQRHVLLAQGRTASAGPPAQPAAGPRRWLLSGDGDRRWAVELRGRHVAVIHAAPAALVEELLRGLWSRWTIAGRKSP